MTDATGPFEKLAGLRGQSVELGLAQITHLNIRRHQRLHRSGLGRMSHHAPFQRRFGLIPLLQTARHPGEHQQVAQIPRPQSSAAGEQLQRVPQAPFLLGDLSLCGQRGGLEIGMSRRPVQGLLRLLHPPLGE